ncbi:MAG TPA: DUF2254 domain-containing protein [Vicinamibacteria bacterium]|nr:DUF2254 domain-containing protein [Vicinamibacteria bacterium]
MTWLQRYRLRTFLASSLWIVPVLGMGLALIAAPALRRIDDATRWTLFGFGVEGARAVLTGLVASVFTFVVFVFSILLVAVQIASANLSPRVIAGLLSQRPVRVCLGLMVFTFVDGLAVLGRVESTAPQLPVAGVITCSLGSIVAFLYVIDYMSRKLRPVSVLSHVGLAGARVVESIYPQLFTESRVEAEGSAGLDAHSPPQVVLCDEGGVVLAFDSRGLAALARTSDAVIELVPQVGDFVAKGDPLFRIHGGRGPLSEEHLLQRIALGAERTLEQDPAFAFRIIVDIASKALSPAINDPTTAVLAIDQLHHLLRNVGTRELDTGLVRDGEKRLRLIYRTPNWEDFVDLAATEIRHFGATSIQVARRQRAMLEDLITALPSARHPPLHEELRLLRSSAERAFSDAEDRARAELGDAQGLGGRARGVETGA